MNHVLDLINAINQPLPPKYYWYYPHAGVVLHAVTTIPNYWNGSHLKAACGVGGLFTNVMRNITPRRCQACCQVTGTPQGTGRP